MDVIVHTSKGGGGGIITTTTTTKGGEGNGGSNDDDAVPSGGRRQPPDRIKTEQQISEERIMILQGHVRDHHRHGQYYEALRSSRDLLAACEEQFGRADGPTPHPATASAHNNLGLMYKLLGRYDESRESYDAALSAYGECVGSDHASYAAALHNLGGLDRAQSTVDETLSSERRLSLNERATERFQRAVAIRELELGVDHPHTVSSLSNLGVAMAAAVLQRKAAADDAPSRTTERDGTAPPPATLTFADQTWEVAERCLRDALSTAIRNPRGKIAKLEEGDDKDDYAAMIPEVRGTARAPASPRAADQYIGKRRRDNQKPSLPKMEDIMSITNDRRRNRALMEYKKRGESKERALFLLLSFVILIMSSIFGREGFCLSLLLLPIDRSAARGDAGARAAPLTSRIIAA